MKPRRFGRETLPSRRGDMCELAKLVVIEDMDLTEKELIQHLVKYDLDNIAVTHVNKHNRLNSASIFCLCNRKFANLLPGKEYGQTHYKK